MFVQAPASLDFESVPSTLDSTTHQYNRPLPAVVAGFRFSASAPDSFYSIMNWEGGNGQSMVIEDSSFESQQITTFTVASLDQALNFQLTSMLLGFGSAQFRITGYDNGVEMVSDIVDPNASDTAGSVSYAFAPSAHSHSRGTMTFGSAWSHIDTFTISTLQPMEDGFFVILDEIMLKTFSASLDAASDTGVAGDHITKSTSPVLTGSGVADAHIAVHVEGQSDIVGSAVADSAGSFRIENLDLAAGTYRLVVEQENSNESATVELTIDDSAAAPDSLALDAASDTGDAGDGVTAAIRPVITGNAEAHAEVKLFDSDGTTELGHATADGNGGWQITAAELDDGVHHLVAKQTDVAGNTSLASTALDVTVDSGRPAAPALAADSDSGIAGDRLTNDATPTFLGVAPAGAVVQLFSGNVAVGQATAGSDGKWLITTSALAEGQHSIRAVVDAGINGLLSSPATNVTIDLTAPAAPDAPLLTAQSDTGRAGDGITLDTTPTLEGTAAALAHVVVYDGATATVGQGVADEHGHWSITTSSLAAGQHQLSATQLDAAGNASARSQALSLKIEVPAPVDNGTMVDGVLITTGAITLANGKPGTSVAVPVLTSGRLNTNGESPLADIPLAGSKGIGQLVARVATGYGLTASGSGTFLADPARELIATIALSSPQNGKGDLGHLSNGGLNFLATPAGSKPLMIQTIKLDSAATIAATPLELEGTSNADQHTALVLDATKMNAPGHVKLHMIDFAAVIGNLTVTSDTIRAVLTGDSAGQTFIVGADSANLVFAGGGNDKLQLFKSLVSTINVTPSAAGDHHVSADAVPTLLHGGAGLDTGTFAGNLADYTVQQHDGFVMVASKAAPGEVVKLVNVEQVQFGDATIDAAHRVELDTLAGLYQDMMGRQADVNGFDYWGGMQQAGASLGAIAVAMLSSEEGVQKFGALTGDAGHDVDALYASIFARSADAAGRDYWVGQMHNGLTLAQVADGMLHSAEIVGHREAAADWDFAS